MRTGAPKARIDLAAAAYQRGMQLPRATSWQT
jgi:hypothetical protein